MGMSVTRLLRVFQISSVFNHDAPAQGAAALARYLNPKEFQVTAISLRHQSETDSLTIVELKRSMIEHISLGMKSCFDGRVLPRLFRLMRTYRPDIVQTHGFRADLWAGIAAKLAGIPLFVASIRNNDWECFRTEQSFPAAQGAMLLSKLSTSLADTLIAVSEGVRSHLVDVQHISPNRVQVIPNGVDMERLSMQRPHPSILRQDLGLSPNAVLVGTLAIMKPRKGLTYLIEAAQMVLARHPQTVFLLAGDGPDYPHILQQVKNAGLENRFQLLGYRSDALAILDALDLYVQPSLFEGLPRSILEAMALGKPVVATDIGGSREAVEHRKTGLLVPAKDSTALVEAIGQLVSSSSLRKSMGEAGKHCIQSRFNARVNAKAHETLYRELLEVKGVL